MPLCAGRVISVRRSPEYELLWQDLPPWDRRALSLHERTIARDAGLGLLRRRSDDGAVFDYRLKGLVIKYRQISAELVELVYVLDLGNDLPPDVLEEFRLLE